MEYEKISKITIDFEKELSELLNSYKSPLPSTNIEWHDHDKANCFEEYTTSYMCGLMTKGHKKILEIDDLKSPPTIIQLKYLYNMFLKNCVPFKSQATSQENNNEFNFRFNVFQTLLNMNKWYLLKITIYAICDGLLQIVYAFIVGELISFLYKDNISIYYGILYAISIAVILQIATLFVTRCYVYCERSAIGTRNLLMGLIFRKSLLIPNYILTDNNINMSCGQIVNIMSNDTMRIYTMISKGMIVFPSIIFIIISICFMIWFIGIESLIGVLIMFSLFLITMVIGNKLSKMKGIALAFTDERVNFLSEMLNGMKVIKFYAFEKPLDSVIQKIRKKELNKFKSIFNWRSVLHSILQTSSYIIIIAILSIKVLLNKPINVKEVYLVIVFVSAIKRSLTRLTRISFIINGIVSINRIQKFFDIIDHKEWTSIKHENNENDENENKYDVINDENDILIEICNANFYHKHVSDRYCSLNMLKNVNLKIYRNELIAIIGSVGSGKSMLIKSILGETHFDRNSVDMDCFKVYSNKNNKLKTGYVGQINFIMNGTIRENIIMNFDFDSNHYTQSITASALIDDLKLFVAGDNTEIGEKGINLSGGQKTRVCFARTFYLCLHTKNIDLLLFDDPFSSVDMDVAQHIFYKGILKLCKQSTIIIVLSSPLQFLDYFSRIIVMEYIKENENENKNGFCTIVENCDCSQNKENLNKLKEKYHLLLTQLIEKHNNNKNNKNNKGNALYDDNINENKIDIEIMQQNKVKQSKLIVSEDRVRGNLKNNSFVEYLDASFPGHGKKVFLSLIIFYMMTQSIWVFLNLFLSWFGDKNSPLFSGSNSWWMLILYGLLISVFIFHIIRTILLFRICLLSSLTFQHKIFNRIIGAPMSYFDSTPIGRITNRFSRDLTIIDSDIPITLEMTAQNISTFISILLVLCIFIPWYILVLLPSIIFMYKLRKIYVSSTRELQRMDGITRSPLYNIFNECIFGLETIRSHKLEQFFITKLEKQISINTQCFFDNAMINRWFGVISEFIITIQILFVSLFVIFLKDSITPNIGALCITLTASFCGEFQFFMRITADLETQLTSVERLHSFGEIEQESNHYNKTFKKQYVELMNNNWPNSGKINIHNLKLRYRKDLPLVLHGISVDIDSGSKIGICGRTGAGKSSIMICLFRIFEAEKNDSSIKIDDIEILSNMGLFDLRSNLSIIPQEPILFSGTLRFNLDPFNKYTDNDIINSLKNVYLWDFFSKTSEIKKSNIIEINVNGLNYKISENGLNLSFGQRQLICIARALLKKPRVLLLDEATSNIDFENDQLIQESIRNNFRNKKCTVLSIAHRLETIIDSDKILVLDKGEIVEFDEPKKLMANKNGHFYKLWQLNNK